MLEYVIRGHDLSDIETIEDLAQKTKSMGIDYLQLALGMSFPEIASEADQMNPGLGAYVKNNLVKEEVRVAILSCYINMIHPDTTLREMYLKKFEAYLANAKYFGASMVASETGNVLSEIIYTEENFTDTAFQEVVTSVQRLVQYGERHNMVVAIEAGLNHPLYSVDRTIELLAAIPSDYLGIILDPTNLISVETMDDQIAIVEKAFQSYGDKIVALHLKDYQVVDNKLVPVNLGEGVIDYQGILAIVKKYRPHCFVVLEETKDLAIKKALTLLK